MKRIITLILIAAMSFTFSGLTFAYDDVKATNFKCNIISDTDLIKQTVERNKSFIKKIKEDKDFEIIFDDGAGNFSYTNSKDTKKSKKDLDAKIAKYSAQSTTTGTMFASSPVIPYSDGYVSSGFRDTVTCDNGLFQDCVYSISGTSGSNYSGLNPYYASSIDQSDTFTANVSVGSLSIGYGTTYGTIYYQSNGFTIAYPQLVGNYYRYDHTYGTITFSAWSISSVSQSDTATYRFGATTISPVCSASIS